ncbi:MAG: hypothetical protein M1827_006410 [Pycnora praestabilis]|nr:MAG: hypothetical protein M1827_006410 [Pycnora praestabilis]
MTAPDQNKPADAEVGAAVYSRWLLAVYDWWVLGIVSSYAWRISAKKTLLPFFRQNIGKQHLDIGVGTGYYLAHGQVPADTQVTLLDLNQNSLDAAKARFGRKDTERLLFDCTQPLPMKAPFDSISMFYLLHCMPGPVGKKTACFANLKHNLTGDGVLYGATILGAGVHHNWFGRFIISQMNKNGIFDNRGDNEAAIVEGLKEHFHDVHAQVVGAVLLFKGERKKI